MFENYLIGLKSDEEAWKERKKVASISRSFPVLFSIGRHICVSFFGFHLRGIRIRFRFRFRNSLGGTRICDTRV